MFIAMALAVIVVLISIALILRLILWKKAEKVTVEYLKKFKNIPELDIYEESKQLFHYGEQKKVKRAVLLLHGYSCSTHELISLTSALREKDITFFAPMLTGFGTGSLEKLYNIKSSDWIRDAVCAYDVLASIAEEVSVVGHSTGSVLAAYIAEIRKVKHLVLIGPNFYVSETEAKFKHLFLKKYIGNLLLWLIPATVKPIRPERITFTDTLEPNAAHNVFHHPTITLKSLVETWKLQDKIDILKARYATLSVLYGKQDLTVDIKPFIGLLDKNNIIYNKFEFENTAHNVLEDYEKDEAVKIILDILNK